MSLSYNSTKSILFFSVLLVTLVTSCGLKYEPSTLPEKRIIDRQKAIKKSLYTEFKSNGFDYKSVSFGETKTIKPNSFIKLDSLFGVKYRLELLGETDEKLDQEIAFQRLIAQSDTIPILYDEEHIFSLTKEEKAEVFHANIIVDKNGEVVDMRIIETIELAADLIPFFTQYELENSFVYIGFAPEIEEAAFYDLYKPKANTLIGKEKERFLIHTFKLMQIANQRKDITKKTMLKEVTRKSIFGDSVSFTSENFIRIDEMLNNKSQIEYYRVEYEYFTYIKNVERKRRFEVAFDIYLQELWKNEL
jgi:hypothetical protein